MRKSLAQVQRTLKKGDRGGSHDWVFNYHPNKEIKKIRKELKVLLGARGLEFVGDNLKKPISAATKDFVNKVWILPKKAKSRSRAGSPNPPRKLGLKPYAVKTKSLDLTQQKGAVGGKVIRRAQTFRHPAKPKRSK